MSDFEFNALKPGETSRTCDECGKEYVPNSRTQRRCPDCRRKLSTPIHEKPKSDRKAAVKEAKKKMEYNTLGLNDAMFRELERIESCDTLEDIEAESIRADRICNLASGIISNGKLMIQAAQMSMGVAESVNVPKALLGNGDGR